AMLTHSQSNVFAGGRVRGAVTHEVAPPSSIRVNAAVGTRSNFPNRNVGISPRAAARYALLRFKPSSSPASGTVTVGRYANSDRQATSVDGGAGGPWQLLLRVALGETSRRHHSSVRQTSGWCQVK